MNHDELLAKLVPHQMTAGQLLAGFQALRAVVKLHKPYEDHVVYCKDCERIYPCSTIQAIEKELK